MSNWLRTCVKSWLQEFKSLVNEKKKKKKGCHPRDTVKEESRKENFNLRQPRLEMTLNWKTHTPLPKLQSLYQIIILTQKDFKKRQIRYMRSSFYPKKQSTWLEFQFSDFIVYVFTINLARH